MKAPVPEYEPDSELSILVSQVRHDARKAKDANRALGRSLARLDEALTRMALSPPAVREEEA